MGHGRHVSGSSYPTPTPAPPVADYNVATNPALSPDCSCNYFAAGTYNGKPYYARQDEAYTIKWQIGYWEIGTGPMGQSWYREDENIEGDYVPSEGAVGTAHISAGPH